MTIPVLATKLFVPSLRENSIARPTLIEKLFSGASRPGCITIVSGPAGFGKTTLLSDFVSRLSRPTAWVSLDEGDNDPVRFWTYLIHAIQAVIDEIGQPAMELLGSPGALTDETIPAMLINDLAAHEQHLLLVLDDFHEIHDPAIHAGMLFLVEHLPKNIHTILSTRSDPPWPLARLRARNQLAEVRTSDLRFSRQEATDFLNHTMGLSLPVEVTAALEERTEGWVAGLQLAALSLHGRNDISGFVEAFTGSHLYVAEYLMEEVLLRQPEDTRTFLLQTAILKRMNAGLCDAVTERHDGQSMLRSLHQANTFLISLDDVGQWFRYHNLFADLLQVRLRQSQSTEEIAALRLRAADWYEDNGFAIEAVAYALDAKDFERAAEMVIRSARTLIFAGQVTVLRNWLEALPETSFQSHPQLSFYRFWIDVLQCRVDLFEGTIREKEELLKSLPPSPENDRLRGELMAVVCRAVALSGQTAQGIRLAQEALAYLPTDDMAARARVNSALATALGLEGRIAESMTVYQTSLAEAIPAGDYRLAAHTALVKGLIESHCGQLHKAIETFQSIIDMPVGRDALLANRVFFPAGQGYIGLGSIYLEWNNLEKAEDYLKRGLELCRRGGLDGIRMAHLYLSRLRQARGDLEGALEEIPVSDQVTPRIDDFNNAIRHIQIELARGNVDGAWSWAEPLTEALTGAPLATKPPLLFFESLQAIVAQVYLARGNETEALKLLEKLQSTAEPGGRTARMIDVHLLRALAIQQQNDGKLIPETIRNIERALLLAEPQGYTLLFLEAGAAVIPLLQAVADRQDAPEQARKYARKLLEMAGSPASNAHSGEAAGLAEPLTPRELEVLALLASGDSNQDIADKLFITLSTVKKHTGNIYGKLGAISRTQAIAQARQLDLLSTD